MNPKEIYQAIANKDIDTITQCVRQVNVDSSLSFLTDKVSDKDRTQNLLFWAIFYLGFIENECDSEAPERIKQHPRWLIVREILMAKECAPRPEMLVGCHNSRGVSLIQDITVKTCFLYNDQKMVAAKAYLMLLQRVLTLAKNMDTGVFDTPKHPLLLAIETPIRLTRGKLSSSDGSSKHNLLHIAAHFGCSSVLHALLQCSPDMSIRNSAGLTALQVLVLSTLSAEHIDVPTERGQQSLQPDFFQHRLEGLEFLLRMISQKPELRYLINEKWKGHWKTDYDKSPQGSLLGHLFTFAGQLTKRQILTSQIVEGHDDSLLHLAVKQYHDKPDKLFAIVQLLTTYGIDRSLKDGNGHTAYQLATARGLQSGPVCRYLYTGPANARQCQIINNRVVIVPKGVEPVYASVASVHTAHTSNVDSIYHELRLSELDNEEEYALSSNLSSATDRPAAPLPSIQDRPAAPHPPQVPSSTSSIRPDAKPQPSEDSPSNASHLFRQASPKRTRSHDAIPAQHTHPVHQRRASTGQLFDQRGLSVAKLQSSEIPDNLASTTCAKPRTFE